MTLPQPVFLHVFPTFAVGGAQMRFCAIANHLGATARHIIVSLDGRQEARAHLRSDVDVTFHNPGGTGLFAALRFLRAATADLIITSNWGAMDWAAAARLLGLPHLHTEDGFGPDEQDRQKPRRVLARRLILRRSRVVLPSRVLLRIATDLWRLPPANLLYVPNGIDVARFANAAPMELPGEGPIIGTVAGLRPEKNLARLLRAFALLRRARLARLVLVGDGREKPALGHLAQELGIVSDTHFIGASPTPERWLKSFDLFALSSDTEQMPLSLLEAMAAGLPAVSTDVGDVRTMLPPESAPFIVPRDDAALAAAMGSLLSDPANARALGARNAARASRDYDQATMFAAWRPLLSGP